MVSGDGGHMKVHTDSNPSSGLTGIPGTMRQEEYLRHHSAAFFSHVIHVLLFLHVIHVNFSNFSHFFTYY